MHQDEVGSQPASTAPLRSRLLNGLRRWLLLLCSTRVIVEGDSMWPALRAGDRLLVNRLAYRLSPPRRGDIVLLRDPQRPGFECIKRIVGLPGERLPVDGGDRGQRTEDRGQVPQDRTGHAPLPRTAAQDSPGRSREADRLSQAYQIPAEHYFVVGDNRAFSRDSRSFGPVHRSAFLGRAWHRYRREA